MIKKNILWFALLATMTGSISSCGLFRSSPTPAAEGEAEMMEEADEAYFEDNVVSKTPTPFCDAVSVALRGYPTFSNIVEDDGEASEYNPNIIHYQTTLELEGMEDYITEFVDEDRRIFIVRNYKIASKAEADKLYNEVLGELESCVLFDPISKMTEDKSNGKLYELYTLFGHANGQLPFVRLSVGKNFGLDGYYVILTVRGDK